MSSHQQLLYHIVFSVKNRRPLLQDDDFREEVWAYMAGVVKNLDGFAIKVGGYYDHAHLLVRIPAKISIAKFVGGVKANTSKHINDSREATLNFHWQDGYGAFTVSPSQSDKIVQYISNQIEHHRTRTFQDEYLLLLKKHGIEYDPKYLWE
ncbi:MAG: IS200/IS605 family transposase [Novipirellula sp. JB048]